MGLPEARGRVPDARLESLALGESFIELEGRPGAETRRGQTWAEPSGSAAGTAGGKWRPGPREATRVTLTHPLRKGEHSPCPLGGTVLEGDRTTEQSQ